MNMKLGISSNPLICYSLRKRPEWATLASTIIQNKNATWKERKLDHHDMALPLRSPGGQPRRVLRVILLSPSDIGTDDCKDRIQRLYHLSGGQDIAIVFLLKQAKGQANPMTAFMMLQLSLVGEFEMPIIPVSSIQAVQPNLMAFYHQISSGSRAPRTTNPAQSLLPYCSDRPPLSEHAVNVLTDITSSMGTLLDTVSTPAGQTEIATFLENDSESIVSFWAKEYLVE
ncbi:uncharacterized protein F4822DRAFT_382082 [Hypoxylon trugodes]|uniref:uncharacterized protein n=1 Tax=Hypoxylon trugodes TaxID=326681 RepID=UPI0021904106|nr:uncharacterized protein F4822DRAFT_382082 [Hypoxylon trugodes]KAI1385061.1 hypothetical protein F4822DRAFT_382082 [Hypoxylon trugodes]